MNRAEQIDKLVLKWEEMKQGGTEISLEELCRDCSALLPELQQQISRLQSMDEWLGISTTSDLRAPESSAIELRPDFSEWAGDCGYEILGGLGRGGMGIVYRARDRRNGHEVALKTIQRISASALNSFKNEFRALADLSHPNLVTLYELASDGNRCFFTMELITGSNFLDYVRDDTRQPRIERLREALRQLADGVEALHETGRLHRDIKPGNVLVDHTGRVVLLDFGLAAELSPNGFHEGIPGVAMGTAPYMSPEQITGSPLSPASDWYSVGVILYRALTGQLPFVGDLHALRELKTSIEPIPSRQLVADIPEDLDHLCGELLRIDPQRRASAEELRQCLGGAMPKLKKPAFLPRSIGANNNFLVGRQPHLQALAEALETVQAGKTVVLHVRGPSGMGKTTLVRRFTADIDIGGREQVVVFTSKCYEQESIPYKAFDGIVDDLAQYLRSLPVAEARELLPSDFTVLAKVFPILKSISALSVPSTDWTQLADQKELRRRAFACLRELLTRIGGQRPVVLCIDDLQWDDVDSAVLIEELMQTPNPPRLLLLVCYRSEDIGSSSVLPIVESLGERVLQRHLDVASLNTGEAEALAQNLLSDSRNCVGTAAMIAQESGGNPFFIEEMAKAARAGVYLNDASLPQELTLETMLWHRVEQLPEAPRRLLEMLVVAGQPLGQEVACRAAEMGELGQTALAVLRPSRLIRGSGGRDDGLLTTYHDRVRETVLSHMTPTVLRHCHGSLARTLEDTGEADGEMIAVHYHGAGDVGRASHYYVIGADRATESLAFDHAASLYRLALQLWPNEHPDRSVRMRLADALANAGRGGEAAQEYLKLANEGGELNSLELQRRAAMLLLMSGYNDQGMELFLKLASAVGLKFPATPRRALWMLLQDRIRLRFRGFHTQIRGASEIPAKDLVRIDICWAIVSGMFSLIDPLVAAYFQGRGLLLALRSGEPCRIVRALAMEGVYTSMGGGPAEVRTRRIFQTALSMAQKTSEPYAEGILLMAQGHAAVQMGHWRNAYELSARSEEIFRTRCVGVVPEIAYTRYPALICLLQMGELAELRRRLPEILADARKQNDLFTESTRLPCVTNLHLAADQPELAQRELDREVGKLTGGFGAQHYNALLAHTVIRLYSREGLAASKHLSEHWSSCQKSYFLKIQYARLYLEVWRAQSALAAAIEDKDAKPWLKEMEIIVRRIERERIPWSDALACSLRAGMAGVRGDRKVAMEVYKIAATRLMAADMGLFASAASRRYGELLGGDEGKRVVAEADGWMRQQQVINPARMADLYAPRS